MDNLLENAGIMAISFLAIYACKKILEHYDLKRTKFCEDKKVYKAADEFVHGAPSDNVKVLLASCLDFDEEDVEKILSRSIPHRTDKDGGYRVFIKAVNEVLGEDVYSEQFHTH